MTLPRAVPRSLPLSKHTNGQLAFRRSHHISSAIFIIFGHNTIIFYLSCAKGQLPLDRGAPRPTSDTLSCGFYHRLGPITLPLDHPGVKSESWSSSSGAGQPEPTSDPGQIDLWPYKTTGCLIQWVDLSSRHGGPMVRVVLYRAIITWGRLSFISSRRYGMVSLIMGQLGFALSNYRVRTYVDDWRPRYVCIWWPCFACFIFHAVCFTRHAWSRTR